jgi:DNA mismatch repair protein MutS
MAKTHTTPLMEQYLKIKAEYQEVILLYRMGDFYETFYEDAKTISRVLGIALTKRAHGKSADVPLAGFPYHALDNHLPKLLNNGLRVAICEQVEDPKLAKGVVKREVVEIASPGATLSDKILDSRKNNFLLAIYNEGERCGIAVADVSTGDFQVSEFSGELLVEQLLRYQPREILASTEQIERIENLTANKQESIFTKRDGWIFNFDYCEELLLTHFKTHSLKGFGCEGMHTGIIAAGVIIHYLQENYKTRLAHFVKLRTVNLSQYMALDAGSRRNLEISEPMNNAAKGKTLLTVLDYTVTPMGARLLKLWLQRPLLEKEIIERRLDLVEFVIDKAPIREALQKELKSISDMERLLGKIVTGRAGGRDLNYLKLSLQTINPIRKIIFESNNSKLKKTYQNLSPLPKLTELIESAIVENPPTTLQEGGLIRQGYNAELDELLNISENGKEWLLQYQEAEKQKTGISSLKISYNKVFGYYLEVTNAHKDKTPDYFIRKQTLVNAERYITPELKEWEEKILGAEEKINKLEYEIFQEIRQAVTKYIEDIQENSRLIGHLDCIGSFAAAAIENNYTRPHIEESDRLEIAKGRHPVIEKNLPIGEDFIDNDAKLDTEKEQIWIITGPNMAGKSTFLRQVGLIVLMAQIGSFVPAEKACIGIVDRIFTRVGASDNLALGESTFLVEMNETANILNNATHKSLILLDEIGRGTSTFDGLSIAWAVAEYIQGQEHLRSKTLFATHYHELTELALLYPRIKNYNVAVKEWNDQVVFLRKIIKGGTDNSYGIYVAQMAGLPPELIERAREILSNLEANELTPNSRQPKLAKRKRGRNVDKNQLNLFDFPQSSPLKKELEKVDINNITPMEALQKLNDLKKIKE